MLLDAHVHIFPPEFIARREQLAAEEPFFALLYADPKSPMQSHEGLLQDMRAGGIDRAWVVGFSWQLEKNARAHNDYLLRTAQEHPEKLRAFAGLWAKAGWAHKEAKRVLEMGINGLGELAFYDQDLHLSSLSPLCNLCAAYNVPLMLHVNEPLGKIYAGKAPMGLGRSFQLLEQHPRCRIILSHMGGGIFFYKTLVPRQVGNAFANLWLDTAATPFLYQPRALKLAVELLGADRVLLGSDYPLLSLKRTLSLVERAGLSEAEMNMVCGQAAMELVS